MRPKTPVVKVHYAGEIRLVRASFHRIFDMTARTRTESREKFFNAPSSVIPTPPAASVRFATVAAISIWNRVMPRQKYRARRSYGCQAALSTI